MSGDSDSSSASSDEENEMKFRNLLVLGMCRTPSPQSEEEEEEALPSPRQLLAQAEDEEKEEEEGAPDLDRELTLIDNRRPHFSFACLQINEFPGKVMTRGVFPAPSLKSINHFKYYSLLKKGIGHCDITEFNSLQKVVAPHFLQGDDCFIIGTADSGKTLSYLMPMTGWLLKNYKEQDPRVCANQPYALIVCSDILNAFKIKGHLYALLSSLNQRELSYDVVTQNKDLPRLRNGLDIVITISTFWSRLIVESPGIINYERLRYMVFEDLDVLLRVYSAEFDTIHQRMSHINATYQRIYCGKKWYPAVEKLYMNLEPLQGGDPRTCIPTLFINSSNQVVKYAEVKWIMHHVSEESKIKQLSSLLRSPDVKKHQTVFIVCRDPETVSFINGQLKEESISTIAVEGKSMHGLDFNYAKQEWVNGNSRQSILIIHDELIRNIGIHNVTCLIHYDMPLEIPFRKLSTGADRFTCMWSKYRDISKEKCQPDKRQDRSVLESHFLLTGNESSLGRLKQFAIALGCELPNSLSVIADEMIKKKLENLPLCNSVKLFGQCVNSCCKQRHIFFLEELESEPVVPRSGDVVLQIAQCINPSLYTARVLKHYSKNKDGKRLIDNSWTKNHHIITQKLFEYFEKSQNKVPPQSFSDGTICAVENDAGFFRVKILQVLTRTAENYPKQVRVFAIDSGLHLQPVSDHLFALPPELQEPRQLAVNLVLGNLATIDCAKMYNSWSISKARELIEGRVCRGHVQMAIKDTVWVTPCTDFKVEDNSEVWSSENTSFRQILINAKVARTNYEHIPNIIELCRKTGFLCAELEVLDNNPPIDPEVQKAPVTKHQQICKRNIIIQDKSEESDEEDSDPSGIDIIGFSDKELLKLFGIELPSDIPKLKEVPTIPAITQNKNDTSKKPKGGFGEYKIPIVHWKQTDEFLTLVVELSDVKKYNLAVFSKDLCFRSITPPEYGFDVKLFGIVNSNPEAFPTGQSIRFKFTKKVAWMWPRITSEEVKYRWLKPEIEEEPEEQTDLPNSVQVDMQLLGIQEVHESDSDYENDDDCDQPILRMPM